MLSTGRHEAQSLSCSAGGCDTGPEGPVPLSASLGAVLPSHFPHLPLVRPMTSLPSMISMISQLFGQSPHSKPFVMLEWADISFPRNNVCSMPDLSAMIAAP